MGKLIFLEALARFKFLERHTVETLKYRIIIYYLICFCFHLFHFTNKCNISNSFKLAQLNVEIYFVLNHFIVQPMRHRFL